MNGAEVKEYLSTHKTRQIRGGKSGAEVWEIEGGYVLKHVRRETLPQPEVFACYRNEAYFYRFFGQAAERRLPCLPEVLEVQVSRDEIVILMKKYGELSREGTDTELLRKIMRALAQIHSQEIPDFLRRERNRPGYLDRERTGDCLEGWRSVLSEHPGVFDERILLETAAKINDIIEWHHGEKQVLCHGDFHWDNLLAGEQGNIVVCDWQGVNAGGASGDISFFVSRLGADGISVEAEQAAELYSQERFLITGDRISREEMIRHMKAANVITTFQFWHEYLHGSSCERVRGIYEKMRLE